MCHASIDVLNVSGELINAEIGNFNRRLSFGKPRKSALKQTLVQHQQVASPPDTPSASPKAKK